MTGSGSAPTEEELAAVLAALCLRADPPADTSPLATWRRRRLAALGQAPRAARAGRRAT